MMDDLHKRLVALQSTEELRRKAERARGKLWSQEELDYAERRGEEIAKALIWE